MTFFRYGYVFLVGATMMQSIRGHTSIVLRSLNVSMKFVDGVVTYIYQVCFTVNCKL